MSGLKIAIVINVENDFPLPPSVHQYDKYIVYNNTEFERVYNHVKQGYDLIVGGNCTDQTNAWIKSKSTTPLVSMRASSIMNLPRPDLLYRMIPDDSRDLKAYMKRLYRVEIDRHEPGYSIFDHVGLVISEGFLFSDSIMRILVDLAVEELGVNRDEYIRDHVRIVPVNRPDLIRNALVEFKHFEYTLFAALYNYDALLDPRYTRYSDGRIGLDGNNIIVLEGGYGTRLPTQYDLGDFEADVYGTSYEAESADETFLKMMGIDSKAPYQPGINWNILLYLQAINRLESLRDVSQLASVLNLEQYVGRYGAQGYQPNTIRYFSSQYRTNLFGIPGIEGFDINGYATIPVSEKYDIVSFMPRTDLIDAAESTLRQDEGGSIKYEGLYNQHVIVPIEDIHRLDLRIPLYGKFMNIQTRKC